ncbi:arsenate reductase ArsC [Halanaerobacter jeridensis]|uniref:Arsenate reductase n=1 Tax=Halanaerobacter jeridensis TaxID=706427 RepID=A0A938XQN9_9FIRM|nr:arsenate reductase ArsC [Halanaerobacter jeridensis]MBM7557697.1 arsenate reductase [Halanaerobacter jeridensis]
MSKAKVLFICTGNSARSQMAEAFLREYDSDNFEAYSGGLKAEGIHPMTKQVMQEVGLDISDQESKEISRFLGKKHFGFLVTVCRKAEKNCPTFPDVSTRLFWDIEDPKAFEGSDEEKLAKFRETRDEVEERVKNFIKEHS